MAICARNKLLPLDVANGNRSVDDNLTNVYRPKNSYGQFRPSFYDNTPVRPTPPTCLVSPALPTLVLVLNTCQSCIIFCFAFVLAVF